MKALTWQGNAGRRAPEGGGSGSSVSIGCLSGSRSPRDTAPRRSTSTTSLIEMVDGRGPDATIDAVGMEAHGGRLVAAAQKAMGLLPDALAQKVTDKLAVDRLDALHAAVKGVRRGGTASVSGVYGGEVVLNP